MKSTMDTSNWRTKLLPDSRQKLINKIMDTLMKRGPFSEKQLQDVKKLALQFEEKIYNIATSQDDYMRKISVKLMNFEIRSSNPMTDSPKSNNAGNSVNAADQGSQGMQQVNNRSQLTPVPVPINHPQPVKQQILPQTNHNVVASSALPHGAGISQSTMSNISGQNSSLQNIKNVSGVQPTSVGNNMGQGIQGIRVPSNNFVSQRQMPGSQQQPQNSQQYRYQQQQLHQMAKQSHIQQHKLSQPSHFQSSQQSIMQNQQPVFPQSSQSMSHQSFLKQQSSQQPQPRMVGPQNNLSSGQHNKLSAVHQQHLGPQSSQKQQQMMNNQHFQSTQGQRPQVDLQQLLMPQLQAHSGQLQNQLDIKPHVNLSRGDIQQRPPTSGALQQQNVNDQQKQLMQPQRVKAEPSSTSSESTAQTGNTNCGDWQEEVFQKMKFLKDKYMVEVMDLYQKRVAELNRPDSLTRQQKSEQFERLKKFKSIFELCMQCLQVPKTNIPPNHNEKLVQVEKYIMYFMTMFNRKPGITTQQPITAPHIDSLHQSQHTQVQPHENQMQSINLQHNKVAALQHNNVGPNPNMLLRQQLKQLQNRDMQQQVMHKQHQFNPQTKQLQQNGNQINNGNDLKVRQMIEIRSESSQQQFKAGPTFSSPQIDQQNQLNSVNKSTTPMQSVNSPFIASSPSTPSTAHMPIESEKVNVCVSSLINAAGNNGQQTTAAMLDSQPVAIGTSGYRASVEASGKSTTIEDPMERLLRAVKSASAKSLSALASDISSVVSTIDSIAGSAPGGEDLVSTTHFCRKRPQDVTTEARKAKFFDVVSSASSVNDSVNNIDCLGPTDSDSTASSTSKRCRVEKINPLVEEIRKINQRLVDTVVEFSEEDVDAAVSLEVGKGTVVKCTFNPVYLRYASAQMPLIQPLQLLVPSNYPNCSPIILDKIPFELSKEYADLSTKAKLRFSNCLRSLSDPMSLEEMIRSWDVCCREVLLEHAQKSGGGTFTSKYGAWEDCLTAV